MFTLTGIFVILCFYQIIKISQNIFRISIMLRKDFEMHSLGEELNRMDDSEFTDWCIDYLNEKKYKYVNKFDEDTIICNKNGEKIYVNCIKETDFNDESIYKLLGLKGINKINKIGILTNSDLLKINKSTLRKSRKLGVEVIGMGEFEESYEEHVKNKK